MKRLPRTDSPSPALKRVRLISDVLDNAIPIPGTPYRVGLDPILGLLPGGGDTIGAILSVYIVFEAARLGVSRDILLRMVGHVIMDALLGVLPVLGDLADVTWKANSRNLALLEAHIDQPEAGQPIDRVFIVLLVMGLLATLLAIGILAAWLVSLLFRWMVGGF
ncbi:hypothetical protein BST81_24270 [Leptolyngbya sp. 'hensonii']|uniref:DUF4112 domain-containing protein n=1 Tax=Leptolyngbya sp. 'hensonii' TaxID=1922337 RepID=UPI00094FCEE3|nr:DUF4112 domain-containing protein [Leptolyngbya sp. 'hensonii']OLP15857.1 hypothetical protein BST81_24270 [Leptolyngbya sp. 'hensonii']